MIKIGYQGEVGSNSEEAARQFADDKYLRNCEFIPLVSSSCVVQGLKCGAIKFGVMAVKNSIAGVVKETQDAMQNESLVEAHTIILPIHHCLFKKAGIEMDAINFVASHIQALNQTVETRKMHWPNLKEIETMDTATAARDLSNGTFPNNYAVICRKNAGEKYGLKLVAENIEDRRDNQTEFKVYRLN